MTKKELKQKYESGFEVCDEKCYARDVEWRFDEEASTSESLHFLAYDANHWPMKYFSTWDGEGWGKDKHIKAALERTMDFKGEVWLDDVKIKEATL